MDDGRLGILRIDRDFSDQLPWDQKWTGEIRALFTLFDGEAEEFVCELPAFRWPCFDRLSNGDIVVVESRGRDNAHIFDPGGRRKAQFDVGDGVEHIIVTPDDRIWVGYFDEGIFGTEQLPDGNWPPPSSGLASFDPSGECVWQAQTKDIRIDDCYALGANGEQIWLCPYSDFRIASIKSERVQSWTNGISGARAIAAAGHHAILAGGYSPKQNRLALLTLENGNAKQLRETDLALCQDAQMIGRNGVLHVIDDTRWVQLSVDHWVNSLTP
ncbi:hypothetical protein L7H23_13340 [Sphingopyxis sp. BSN-002]|uniref:hypothetical protein n=1 Tax=Sphingopyxis sp. BSN-002 TaxID=2911495 RepID=UPI001EDAF106|nr:hypothetical protein [Sphingopyxis sp. BSN-002]UKK83542.1 hypothetical protein L7H23_13340 [Sphingopyxis sp. BSN-002]